MIIFYISARGGNLSSLFPDTPRTLANRTHTADAQSTAAKETDGGSESEGGYRDEARGLLFSLLISLNLLIPILKPATSQRCRLLCVAPSQIKLSFIPVPFKHYGIHRSSISFAFPSPRLRRPYLFPDALCKLGHL